MMKKTILAGAIAAAMGTSAANAAVTSISITQMVFGNTYAATGSIDIANGSGVFTSVDPFYSNHWTATVQTVFSSSGTWAGTSPQGAFSYQFTVDTTAGDVAAVGTYFDWATNLGIPVLTVFNCGAGNVGDACTGLSLPMATLPFPGQQPTFNGVVAAASSPVPVPAAVWLMGSGLVGLVGVARRRRRAA
ncbi:VPLPA-CTERM sorting domain-containing protein [Thiohalobacter sp.]|uniref:VPLPA-CTERM sorting domain-containing protein n=1 Tax=Thiohalobacter sp. TaxID=2025948 RepID=UPI002633ED05|nr:VPLPA-CTERM sorting domain-containing protein [Thiohalobacter sp.]